MDFMDKFNMDKINEKLGAMKKKLDSFVSEDEAFWMGVAMFLFGVIVGMILSPRKNIAIGSNNGYYGDTCDCDDCCDCDCCDCDCDCE